MRFKKNDILEVSEPFEVTNITNGGSIHTLPEKAIAVALSDQTASGLITVSFSSALIGGNPNGITTAVFKASHFNVASNEVVKTLTS